MVFRSRTRRHVDRWVDVHLMSFDMLLLFFAQLDWTFQSLPKGVPKCGRQETAVFSTTWVVVLARREKQGWIVAFCSCFHHS